METRTRMETRKERSERIKKGQLREGWTTGTCASASAKLATYLLLGGEWEKSKKIRVSLPIKGRVAELAPFRYDRSNGEAWASVIKDAGDDPDVTHGAEIGAIVRFGREKGIKIIGGEGVGIVTKPGLGLEVGQPDITQVPRKMIKNSVIEAVLEVEGRNNTDTRSKIEKEISLEVEIFVPEGRERGKKTMLERLGVIGGIGILGTLGIVIPYSTGAWRASIARQISVISASGVDTVVCTTGRQSEELAKKYFSELPDFAFVDIGDFIGYALSYARRKGLKRFIYAGFFAKLSKVAKGEVFTHAKKSSVDINFLAGIAEKLGYPEHVVSELRKADTGRRFVEIAKSLGAQKVFQKVAELVKEKCEQMGKIHTEVIIFDFSGGVLAYAK